MPLPLKPFIGFWQPQKAGLTNIQENHAYTKSLNSSEGDWGAWSLAAKNNFSGIFSKNQGILAT